MAFMGRERELAHLARAIQRASDGEASRVLVAGQAGIGVSSLLDELETRLADVPDVLVARGQGYEPQAGQPYAAVAQALRTALASLPDERLAPVVGPAGHDLCALLPDLVPRLDDLAVPRDPPALSSVAQLGNRVVESILGAMERLAATGIVVLALEDLHWSDPATRRFIDAMLGTGRRSPICLILTYEPDALHRRHPAHGFIAALANADGVERIDLGPLSSDELQRISLEMGGDRPAGSFLAALMEGSGGNPLRATQLITAHARLAGMRLSDPFEEVLAARLDALSPGGLRAVRLLAAVRRPLPRHACTSLPMREGRLDRQALDDALASGLAVERPGDAIAIAHELYAEAIEALCLPPERQAVHGAVALSREVSPAEAAWHLTAALQPVDARSAHLAAAAAAQRLDPGETALFQYQAALDLGESTPDSADPLADVTATLVAAGAAAAAAGSFRRAAALVKRAIDARPRRVGTATGERPWTPEERVARLETRRFERTRQGVLHERLGRYRWASGDLVGGLQNMHEALALIDDAPSQARAGALAVLAQHLMLDGSFAESAGIANQACDAARATEPIALDELGHATCTLGVDMAYLGQLDRGLALLEEATDIARRTGSLDDLMRAYANRTTLLDLDSRREQALSVVNEGIRDARAAGTGDTYGAFLRGNAADILFNLGRWAESEVECRAGMAYRPAGVPWFSPILYLGLVLVESRADEEATRLVGQTLLQLEQVPAGQWTALVLRAAVSLLLWRGEAADAVAVASREWDRVLETGEAVQIAMASSTALEAAVVLAEAGRQRRDYSAVATAGELAARTLADAERSVADSPLSPTLGARREAELHLDMARAHLARLRGKPSATAWARLAEAWAAVPVPYQQAKARWWQAQALLQAGDGRHAAQAPLREAWQISGELPSAPLRWALADLARRARIVLPGAAEAAALAHARPKVIVPVAREARRPLGGPALTRAGGGRVPVGPGADDGVPSIAERFGSDGTRVAAAPFGLSPREMEVLQVLTEGRTNREIADRLFISDRTVGVHVRRILAKLGVAGRTEAAGKAIRLGLVPDEPVAADALRSGRG